MGNNASLLKLLAKRGKLNPSRAFNTPQANASGKEGHKEPVPNPPTPAAPTSPALDEDCPPASSTETTPVTAQVEPDSVDGILLKSQAIHTAAAARSFTRLFCVLIDHPGTGPQVSPQAIVQALDQLLTQAHLTTQKLIENFNHDNQSYVNNAMRSMILGEVCNYLASNWRASHAIDASALERIGAHYANALRLDQETVDAIGKSSNYVPATTQQQEDAHYACAATGAISKLLTTVQAHDYHFEREPIDVATDLLKIVFDISNANTLMINDIGARTSWMYSTVNRATQVVQAHYEKFVKKAIESSRNDGLYSEVSLKEKSALYPKIIENIQKLAVKDFAARERHALTVLGDRAHKIYLKHAMPCDGPESVDTRSSDTAKTESLKENTPLSNLSGKSENLTSGSLPASLGNKANATDYGLRALEELINLSGQSEPKRFDATKMR